MLNIRGGVVMRFLGDFLGQLLNHQRGATAIEYALIASLISVAAIVSFETLGGTVENRYSTIEQTLNGSI